MQAALQILGCGPTYHGFIPMYNPSHCASWTLGFEAKYHHRGTPFTLHDWDRLLGSYGSVTDMPAICFAEELIATYPNAKVVLVEREIESWYRSFSQGLIEPFYLPIVRVLAALDPGLLWKVQAMFSYVYEDRRGFFRAGSKREVEGRAREVYREHYAFVRGITPRERLLEFELGDGWGPLCGFLGKEVPDVPFPRLNDADGLAERIRDFKWRSFRNVLRNVGAVVVGLFAILWAWRWMV